MAPAVPGSGIKSLKMDYEQLYKFLKEETGKSLNDASPVLRLKKDLGVYGDEAIDFIERFSREFNIDVRSFDVARYFGSEVDAITEFLLRFFQRTKSKKRDLTTDDLKAALVTGRLI